MKTILLAFALFSRIPLPNMELKEENMRFLMAAFPLVGVAVAVAVVAWDWLCAFLGFGPFLRGAVFAVLPIMISGAIHMDGFCDTADALASHGDAEKKQRILKDPHTGAFAVIAAFAYILAFGALAAEGFASAALLHCFALAFVLSRCLTGLAVILFPGAPQSSLVKQFRDAAAKRICAIILLSLLAALFVAMILLGGAAGLVAFAAPLALFLRMKHVAAKQFGGMSGDLSGFLLHLCELASLAAVVVVPKILEKL